MTILPLFFVAAVCALGVAVADPAPIRIALVSDPHVTRGTTEDQALYKNRFDKVIADVNAAGVDVVLIAGDLTQGGKPDEIADFAVQVRGFTAPARWVLGNHDVGAKILADKPGGVTGERVARLEAGLGSSFFAAVRGGGRLRIVGVNSALLGSGLGREADQWAFLETELAAKAPAGTTTLLLSHYPPFLTTADEPGGDYWNIEPAPRKRLLALCKKGGVSAVLSGHLHRPLRNRHEGIVYVTTHPVSFGLPRGKQPQGWTLVTVGASGNVEAESRNIAD